MDLEVFENKPFTNNFVFDLFYKSCPSIKLKNIYTMPGVALDDVLLSLDSTY